MADAAKAAGNANNNPSGYGGSGSANPSSGQWSGAVGKTVYTSPSGNTSVGVGVGAEGRGTNITGGQVGASLNIKF